MSCYGDIRDMHITSLCAVDQLFLVPVSFACFSFALPSEFSKAQFSAFKFQFLAGLVFALFSIVHAGHLNEVLSEQAALTTVHMLPWSSNPLFSVELLEGVRENVSWLFVRQPSLLARTCTASSPVAIQMTRIFLQSKKINIIINIELKE